MASQSVTDLCIQDRWILLSGYQWRNDNLKLPSERIIPRFGEYGDRHSNLRAERNRACRLP